MKIYVAGEARDVQDGLLLSELIAQSGIDNPQYVTVSVNDDFAEPAQFAQTVLHEGDRIEFLFFMGGGSHDYTPDELTRYSRNIILKEIGVEGQDRLLAGRVLIIGAGGLGSPAALYLAAAGVGTLGIADADEVDLSNLQRQVIHTTADVHRRKVDSARDKMLALNPGITVRTHHAFVQADNITDLIADYDFVLDGTDNFAAKFLINDACVLAGKPFSHAGIIRFTGQLTTYVPEQGPCYRCLFREPPPPNAVPTCAQAGVIGAMAGTIGTLQALEAVKFLTGAGTLLTGKLLTFNALTMEFRTISLKTNPRCRVCGPHRDILRPFDYAQEVCEGVRPASACQAG